MNKVHNDTITSGSIQLIISVKVFLIKALLFCCNQNALATDGT